MGMRGTPKNTSDLGLILQQARLQAGLTQRQLAEQLGTNQAYIWDLENGKGTIALERIFQYMQFTGVKMTLEVPSE